MKMMPLNDFPGYYAGLDGEIYCNLPRGRQKGIGNLRKLKPNIQTNGKYFYVNVKGNNGHITKRVHRLVCSAFHGEEPFENATVSHLDGNWKNNSPENLKWESQSDNSKRKIQHGTEDVGFKNSRASIDEKTLISIKTLLIQGNLTHKQIGDKFNLSRVFITKIANGYRYKGQG